MQIFNVSRLRPRTSACLVGIAATIALGCGGGEKAPNPGATSGGAVPPNTPSTTAAAPAAALPSPQPGTPPAGATVAMLAEGDSIFHGLKAGGICQTCHGPDAAGTALAPPLANKTKWLTGDGSYAFIQQRITTGVPNPTPPYTTAMPPMGGAPLTPEQLQSVSAYVYSISRTK